MKDKPFRSGSTKPMGDVSGGNTECEGLIVAHHGVAVEVRLADGARRMVRIKRNSGHVVGDKVTVKGETLQRLPRRTELRRRDVRGGIHLVAANLDVLGVVAAQQTPTGFIDRAIVAARAAGLAPFLVINKCDLEEMNEISATLSSLYAGSLPVFPLSALARTGLVPLQEFLSSGHRGVFVGTTGVGKSALLNALCPDIDLKVGSASEYKHMGRHTTTVATLHTLAGGGELVDTPGFRDFGLVDITMDDLAAYYAGFEEHDAFACRFRNCRHRSEPGCAVTVLLEQGRIPAERYATYLDLLSEVEFGEEYSRSRNWRN